jgi:hypothetical protein
MAILIFIPIFQISSVRVLYSSSLEAGSEEQYYRTEIITQPSYGNGQLSEGRMNVYMDESLAGSLLRN